MNTQSLAELTEEVRDVMFENGQLIGVSFGELFIVTKPLQNNSQENHATVPGLGDFTVKVV